MPLHVMILYIMLHYSYSIKNKSFSKNKACKWFRVYLPGLCYGIYCLVEFQSLSALWGKG